MDEILSFVTTYHDQLALLGATLFFVLVIGYHLHKAKKVPGEEPMKKEAYILGKRQLRQQERTLIADEVEGFLLRLYTEGKINEDRYKSWHMRFGTQLGLKDLLPGKLTPIQVKQAAKARLAAKDLVYKPVSFPKESKAKKAKNIVDGLLNGNMI